MVMEGLAITFAFLFGVLARFVGLPPLVGFLAAGFAINVVSSRYGGADALRVTFDTLAYLGVLLLLFTVGLKLKLRQISAPHVVGTSLVHFGLATACVTPVIWVFFHSDTMTGVLVAIALAFSSTVLAAKMLETKRELALFHGRSAIGVLVVQDVIALVVLAIFAGKVPGSWALLALGVPLLRPVLYALLDRAGHDEVLVLAGMLFALVIGGVGFEAIGLKGEIGALVMGILLSGHPKATELTKSLWSLREMFLVGFFLSIGMAGLPGWGDLVFAAVMVLLLPVKGAVFFALFVAFHLRPRTAFLAALSLTAYSEFGLIVVAGVPEVSAYLVPMAMAVAVSFVVAAPLNRVAHPLYDLLEPFLSRFERGRVHVDETTVNLGPANVVIFGMGRTGSSAYRRLKGEGLDPIGIDADTYCVASHLAEGRNVAFADVEDSEFWKRVDLRHIKVAILAMGDLEAKVITSRGLRKSGFDGPIVSHVLYREHVSPIEEAGGNTPYLTMQEAGRGLAQHALEALEPQSSNG